MQENILVWKSKLKNYSKVKETQEIWKLKEIHGRCDGKFCQLNIFRDYPR